MPRETVCPIICARSSIGRASACGAEGYRFEPCRAYNCEAIERLKKANCPDCHVVEDSRQSRDLAFVRARPPEHMVIFTRSCKNYHYL